MLHDSRRRRKAAEKEKRNDMQRNFFLASLAKTKKKLQNWSTVTH